MATSTWHPLRLGFCTLLLLTACADDPTTTSHREPEPSPAPRVLGVYEFTLTGIGTSNVRASAAPVPLGPAQSLSPLGGGLVFEATSSGSITHGVRGQGGHRYITFTYRVRNMTGAPIANLTMIPVTTTSTIAGTPFTSLLMFNGNATNSAVASQIVPAGEVSISDEGGLRGTRTDVLQVFEESEVAAITLPAGYTGIFPYGFVARNPATPGSRTLPATTDPNTFAGLVTYSFRYPLQPTSDSDPYTITFQALAVDDTETRVTESIEEGQDSAAARLVGERAAALGATTVTVLAGSPAADPDVPDYTGQRQICSVRTAGTAGSPVTFITNPAAYARVQVYRPGESPNACGAYFRTGTAQRAAYNLGYALTLRAMDIYGNVKTTAVDTVRLESVSGPPVTLPAPAALVSGARTLTVTYSDYGSSVLRAVGRRNRGMQSVAVAGITRTWSGNASTDWRTPANWVELSVPGAQDTVLIPSSRPNYPLLAANESIGGVAVQDAATLNLASFDLTASAGVATELSGAINATTGRLVLAGTAQGVRGTLPQLLVTGYYILDGNVDARGRVRVTGGRLRASGFRMRATNP